MERRKEKKLIASGKYVFQLYQMYGVPPELCEDIAKELGIDFDMEGFKNEFKKHQGISRKSAYRFKRNLGKGK